LNFLDFFIILRFFGGINSYFIPQYEQYAPSITIMWKVPSTFSLDNGRTSPSHTTQMEEVATSFAGDIFGGGMLGI